MKIKVAIVALLVTLFTLGVVQEASAQSCIPTSKSEELLKKTGQKLRATFLFDGVPAALYVNPQNKQWVILAYPRPTMACLSGSGRKFASHDFGS